MKVLVNKGSRRLGIPGRPAIILAPEESTPLGPGQLEEIQRNKTASRWLTAGVLVVAEDGEVVPVKPPTQPVAPRRVKPTGVKRQPKTDDRKPQQLPEGLTGEGVELHHAGGGWWDVFVNGFKATDRKVRKEEAESIAKDYE